MTENQIATIIVDTAFRIHRDIGPGLFESVYERIMEVELTKRGLNVLRQEPIPIIYHDEHFKSGFRCDLLIEHKVIVEVKSIEALHPVHKKTGADLPAFRRQAIGAGDKFQCGVDKGWDRETGK